MHKDFFIKDYFMKGGAMSSVVHRTHGDAGAGHLTATDLSLHFEGLANPTRLKIVERLGGAVEVRVSELADLCKVSQPRMSWHLMILRRAGVVRTRREGREVFCRLDREGIAAHLRSFLRLVANGAGEPFDFQQLMSEVGR